MTKLVCSQPDLLKVWRGEGFVKEALRSCFKRANISSWTMLYFSIGLIENLYKNENKAYMIYIYSDDRSSHSLCASNNSWVYFVFLKNWRKWSRGFSGDLRIWYHFFPSRRTSTPRAWFPLESRENRAKIVPVHRDSITESHRVSESEEGVLPGDFDSSLTAVLLRPITASIKNPTINLLTTYVDSEGLIDCNVSTQQLKTLGWISRSHTAF